MKTRYFVPMERRQEFQQLLAKKVADGLTFPAIAKELFDTKDPAWAFNGGPIPTVIIIRFYDRYVRPKMERPPGPQLDLLTPKNDLEALEDLILDAQLPRGKKRLLLKVLKE